MLLKKETGIATYVDSGLLWKNYYCLLTPRSAVSCGGKYLHSDEFTATQLFPDFGRVPKINSLSINLFKKTL
jgi:hypothetical protein